MQNTKDRRVNNRIEILPLDNIRQEKRIEMITDDIIAGLSRVKILEKYSQAWECEKRTINAIYKEACIKLSEEIRADKEQVRAISNIRLEGVWDDAKTVNQKLKTIDLINKTNNIYDNNVNVSTGEDGFVFEIGVETEEKKEAYDDDEENEQE